MRFIICGAGKPVPLFVSYGRCFGWKHARTILILLGKIIKIFGYDNWKYCIVYQKCKIEVKYCNKTGHG